MKRGILHRSKYTQWAFVVSGIGVCLLLAGVVFARLNHQAKLTTSSSTLAPITREQAIPRAQDYLLHDLNTMDPTLRFILDFLQRKFSLDKRFSGQVTPIRTTAKDPILQAELKAVARIAYKDSFTHDLGPQPTFVSMGANCDHIPLPSNFDGQLEQEIHKGGYELTHAFLAMQFMKELGCNTDNLAVLNDQAINGMVQMAASDSTEYDLRLESTAFLLYGGRHKDVDPRWIDRIYATQNQDGGWSLGKSDPKSDDHATVLALWAVLEYSRPDADAEPIIRQPNGVHN